MKLDITTEDARFVHAQLQRRLHDLETELAHSEQRDFKHALAADVTNLKRIADQIASSTDLRVEEAV